VYQVRINKGIILDARPTKAQDGIHQSVDMGLTSRVQCWRQRDCTLYHHIQSGTTLSPLTLDSSAESRV